MEELPFAWIRDRHVNDFSSFAILTGSAEVYKSAVASSLSVPFTDLAADRAR